MNTFYQIDSSKVSVREYLNDAKSPAVLIALLCKALRVRLPSSVDDPPVESLAPFEVPESALPDDVRTSLLPLIQELTALGFHSPIFHIIPDTLHSTQIHFVTCQHSLAATLGRIQYRVWHSGQSVRRRLFTTFLSEFQDGGYLVSTSGRLDLIAPENHVIHRRVGAGAAALWADHQQKLAHESARRTVVSVSDEGALRDSSERYHVQIRDFHLARGVFAPLNPAERQLVKGAAQSAASGQEHGGVIAEIQQLQNKKVTWTNGIMVFVLSAAMFAAAGAREWDWKTLSLLLPVLFFHELGHYVAMRVFKYRNLRMFFIPFFGAAVMGQNYNVAGWKKAIVSLMGPTPGIFLGALLGGAGIIFHQPLLIKTSLMLLIVNGMNLVPVLPFDGGHVVHTVLFVRHPLLDTAFRVLALGGLFLLGTFAKTPMLVYLAIPMAMGVPVAYKIARITAGLRARGVGADTSDADTTLPEATAQTIIAEVRGAFPKMNNKMTAQRTLHIFETLNARPPSIAASVALLGIHGISLVMAMVFGVVFVVGQAGALGGLTSGAGGAPKHQVACVGEPSWKDPVTHEAAGPRKTLVVTLPSRGRAAEIYNDLRGRLPGTATLRQFGDSVLLGLPAADDVGRKKWFEELHAQDPSAMVDSADMHVRVTLACTARNAEAAESIQNELDAYFLSGSMLRLVPPWQPNDARSSAEIAQHRKARRTYMRLQKTSYDSYSDPAWLAAQEKMGRARQQGDTEEVRRLQESQRTLAKQLARQKREKLRSEGESLVDSELIDLYAALPARNGVIDSAAFKEALLGTLAPRMGQLGADAETTFTTRTAFVAREGLQLNFHWVTYEQLGDGLPAMMAWLCAKGCADAKYEFGQGRPSGDRDSDESDDE